MKLQTALKLACDAIDYQVQKLAVQANLQDIHNANLPSTINASKLRAKLLEAKKMILELKENYFL